MSKTNSSYSNFKRVRLTKYNVKRLESLSNRIRVLRDYFESHDVDLEIDGNGSVWSNLDCALCSIDTILQEY